MRSTSSVFNGSKAVQKMVFAAIFAAITYVVFAFLSIKIPTPGAGQVSVHLGNAFVVLGALLLGGVYGGIGGALGLTIADLIDPVYIVEAPITFVIKLLLQDFRSEPLRDKSDFKIARISVVGN